MKRNEKKITKTHNGPLLKTPSDRLKLGIKNPELEEIMKKFNNVSPQYGLIMNAKETKVLIVDQAGNNQA